MKNTPTQHKKRTRTKNGPRHRFNVNITQPRTRKAQISDTAASLPNKPKKVTSPLKTPRFQVWVWFVWYWVLGLVLVLAFSFCFWFGFLVLGLILVLVLVFGFGFGSSFGFGFGFGLMLCYISALITLILLPLGTLIPRRSHPPQIPYPGCCLHGVSSSYYHARTHSDFSFG